jgi:hypothetical protein
MGLIERINRMFDGPAISKPATLRGERASDRFDTTVRACFDGSSFALERAGNVGIGGFCFEHYQALPVGTRVRLLIELTGTRHWIRVSGEVLGAIQRGKRTGVRGRFLRIHLEDERLLARWLDGHNRAVRAA